MMKAFVARDATALLGVSKRHSDRPKVAIGNLPRENGLLMPEG